ncbi:mycothiol system anti-sigma-R factor [Propioniciclava tarda]|nr:mycothiol system anti-sigma-R factor [Propioniciclava tarda]SMO51524.1 mycothiol system anti-sigma-R factor [Propioniciclava tarda]HOA88987.1 mycothiol system anti-sigma-R factor [Propioniciclava tarda]HQA30227.1 mycothiol system anti-sigma-R factor [Propioniciclava tarda]
MTTDHTAEPASDCSAVLDRLWEFLDGECSEAEADEIRQHLDACDRCVEDADVAVALKALVQRCCRTASAPTTLRTSIMKQYGCSTYSSVEYTEVTRFIVPPAS